LKIGERRLGSQETGQAFSRAAIELAKWKVDVANMSYGENFSVANRGQFAELLRNDVINKTGCVFVAAAGNSGPELSSVIAPGAFDEVISVGAYTSPNMNKAQYSLCEENNRDGSLSFSSMGPTNDGDVGVDIYAPGAAVSTVPQHTLQKARQANGTSMASPNAAGCVALLISGLKQEKIAYNPYVIKAAIKHTGLPINDIFNNGLLQVEAAWNYLTKVAKDQLSASLHYDIKIKNRDNARGIYLKDVYETNTMQEFDLEVLPRFMNADDPTQNLKKVNLELRVQMKASHEWISCPEYSVIDSTGREMNFRVDPSNLTPGFHFGTIKAYDVSNPNLGPIFTVPVTVCKPDLIGDAGFISYKNIALKPADVIRKFIAAPANANFAEIVVTTKGNDVKSDLQMSLKQLHPQSQDTKYHTDLRLALTKSGIENIVTTKKVFPVLPGVTLDLCLCQFWKKFEPLLVTVEISFHSILLSASGDTQGVAGISGSAGSTLLINAANNGFSRFDVSTPICRELVAPKITFGNLILTRQTPKIIQAL
jgi:tripeptidyl-peptidase-2